MSFDFSFEEIANSDKICFYTNERGNRHYHWRFDALIWACLLLDMNGITDENLDEWEYRLKMEKATGRNPLRYYTNDAGELVDWWPSREELELFKGLSTNVSTKTRAQYKKKLLARLEDDAKHEKLEGWKQAS